MKKLSFYLSFILIFFPTNNLYAWEKVPVPNYVDKKTKSPWNFYENFEDQTLGKINLKKYHINDKGSGKKPFKIKQDANGNKFLEISVEHGWNKCCGTWVNTERAEFEVKPKKTLNKEIWYGFRMRFPESFDHINDRLLVTQFKNQFKDMKKSPLVSIHFYENGDLIDIGGDTGGIAKIKYNKSEAFTHRVSNKFYKKGDKYELYTFKIRNQFSKYARELTSSAADINFPRSFKKIHGQWNTYKFGIKNSKSDDGFIRVYINDELVLNYSGITWDWKKANYTGSHIRIGPYRDSDPLGIGYPRQSIQYDDFIVVSDKKTLDKYLN